LALASFAKFGYEISHLATLDKTKQGVSSRLSGSSASLLPSTAKQCCPTKMKVSIFYQVRQDLLLLLLLLLLLPLSKFDFFTPNFQNYTQFSRLYLIFKIIPDFQNYT
jgi:hypothetical protein